MISLKQNELHLSCLRTGWGALRLGMAAQAWLVASLLTERYAGRTSPLVHHGSLLEMFNKFRNGGGNVIWQNNSVWKALFQLGKQLSYLLNEQTVMKYLP